MAQAMLNVRIDSKDKKEFENFCKDTGMNVSVAINMYVKAVIREKRIPFEITTDPFYSETNLKRLSRAIEQLEASSGTERELIDKDDV
ncbi:MAG: type II toxin-antitoxin system RelB/DinJ family antitoxin [Eubacterium sp.]|jgi:DNA-damage-inducible protein J